MTTRANEVHGRRRLQERRMASNLILEPLESPEFLNTLREFQIILMTCIGPKGGLKMLISAAGYNTVTSASRRLLDNMSLNNPVCAYISQVMRHCPDYGLYMGVIVTTLLQHSLSNSLNLSVLKVRSIVQELLGEVLKLCDSPSVKLKVDFDTVQQLLPVARSILVTKPVCGLRKAEIEMLNVHIVKAFLQTIGKTMGQVLVECKEGCSTPSKIYTGALYCIGLDESIPKIVNQKFTTKSTFSLLLFTIMLMDESKVKPRKPGRIELDLECQNTPRTVEQAQRLLEKAVELGVDIVACQKVVHPSLVLYLQRKGILLLQRLGTELAQAVGRMSHATPVSCTVVEDLRSMLGSVGAVRMVGKGYVLLEQKDGNVATLLASCPNEECASELKVVIKQSLFALQSLLKYPFVAPGAGCMEMWIAAKLASQVEQEVARFSCSQAELSSCVSFVQKALLSAVGLKGNEILVDSAFGHGWLLEKDACFCGMVSRENVKKQNGKWGKTVGTNIPSLIESSVLDVYQNKIHATNLVLECYSSILDIAMVMKLSSDEKL